ncbi:MAG TPA: hypothetical protein VMV95_02620 [Bacillota bacterium]|nr:hypothetical protein [Bacillota bacterium]
MSFFKKVYTNKKSGQKLITIPADEDIVDGDWVLVSKADPKAILDNFK